MPVKPKITLVPGKTYTYTGNDGVYSVIAGEILEGEGVNSNPSSVPTLTNGDGAPDSSSGKTGDVHIDKVNFKIYTRSAGGWDSGSLFKGSDGSSGQAGARGKTTLEGDGPPGSGTNLANSTAALSAALEAEGLALSDLQVGDLYLDTTNHRFYKKTVSGWVARAQFKGADGATGLKGSDGAAGKDGSDGVSPLHGLLTNEVHTVPSTATGKVKSGLDVAGGSFRVYQGASLLSSGVSYAVSSETSSDATYSWKIVGGTSPNGLKVRVNKSTGAYDVSETVSNAWTAETAAVELVATHTASGTSITKVYKISKSMGSTTVSIKASGLTFRQDSSGNSVNPSAYRTFKAERQGHSATGNVTWNVYGVSSDGTVTDLTSVTNVATSGVMLSTPASITIDGTSTTNTDKTYATMTGGQFDAALGAYDSVKIRATFDSIYDEVTVVPVVAGAAGSDGVAGAKTVTTSAIALGSSPAGLNSYGCLVGDTLIDTVNHKIYTRASSSTWTLVGNSFKGSQGDTGAGLKKYSSGLTGDMIVSTTGAILAFNDPFEDLGSVVSMNGIRSEFTIPTTGKYNVQFTPVFDVQNTSAFPSAHALSVGIMAAVEKQAQGSSVWTALLHSTSSTEVGAGATTELEFATFNRTLTFASGTKIRFTADRSTALKTSDSTSTLSCVVRANAVDGTKGETSSDTWILIQKL